MKLMNSISAPRGGGLLQAKKGGCYREIAFFDAERKEVEAVWMGVSLLLDS